jgi:hypothetical protein
MHHHVPFSAHHIVWTLVSQLLEQQATCGICLQVLECSWDYAQPLSSTTAMSEAAVTAVSSSWSGSYALLGSADGVVRLEGRHTASGKWDGRWVRSLRFLVDSAHEAIATIML